MSYKKYFLTVFAIIFLGMINLSYALKLPSNLISLDSLKGEMLFTESNVKKDYWPLARYYTTENDLTFCAVASGVMALNSLCAEKPVALQHAPYHIFTQTNFFTPAVLKIITPAKIEFEGMTLPQLAAALKTFGLNVKIYYGNEFDANSFRKLAVKALKSKNSIVIINYDRKITHEVGGGHFSPIAAYNKKSDRFLLMDVARYKYPPTWIPTKLLTKAMQTEDHTSKKDRGFLIVTNPKGC